MGSDELDVRNSEHFLQPHSRRSFLGPNLVRDDGDDGAIIYSAAERRRAAKRRSDPSSRHMRHIPGLSC